MTAHLPSVLIVSNGRGEDTVGAALAGRLATHLQPMAFPLVGMGEAYAQIPLLHPRRDLPSGGFGFRGSIPSLVNDLRAGIVGLWRGQLRTLQRHDGTHAAVIAVGDVYCLWMAAHAGSPCVFVATAKSAANERHRVLEVWAMRRHAAVVFTRDHPTAVELAARSIPARFAGNPLMDTIAPPAAAPFVPREAPAVMLMPGSRSDAIRNAILLLQSAQRVQASADAAFICALPPTVPMADLRDRAVAAGWRVDGSYLISGRTMVLLTQDFGSAVRAAAVAIGLAGTANEQAAGIGVPVVAFSPPGAVQFTRHFLQLQRKLLGAALVATSGWEGAADAAVRLLHDQNERIQRGAEGRRRMGPPGAVEAIASHVLAQVRRTEARAMRAQSMSGKTPK